jgi:hypothetical protein
MKRLLLIGAIALSSISFGQETIKIGKLEVMTKNLGEMTWEQMTWEDAMKACADLGDGWRLPTKKELNILYKNKDKIGGFASGYYWSSTEFDANYIYVWGQNFYGGSQYDYGKSNSAYARAVRTL